MSVEMFKDKRVLGVLAVCIVLLVLVWLWPIDDLVRLISASAIIAFGLVFCLVFCKSGGQVGASTEPTDTPAPDDSKEKRTEMYIPEVKDPSAFLSELPIETIEGIGHTYGEELRNAGIVTVQDLLVADVAQIVRICDVPDAQAERWIAMGRFAWIDGISEEDAEAIVFATGIMTLNELSEADPDDVLSKILKAVEDGTVRVPEGYEFTIEMVRRWIDEVKGIIL